jgi:dihydrofolate reductase
MRKVVASEFVSLDGVMEGPGPADPYVHAGWTMAYWSDEIGQFKHEELEAADALLLGRVTYEGFAAAWPQMTDAGEFGDLMNNLPKLVASTSLERADWNNSTIIRSNVADEVARLKQQSGRNILIGGSARLIQSLLPHGLIDEFRLLVYPVVLGSGKRLFGDQAAKVPLQLVESKPVGSGVVALVYQLARD